MAQPSSSLAAQIRDLLPALRDITGPAAKPVLCFDRGGWSPALFADITDAGFDLLTYRKNDTGSDIPDLPEDAFTAASWPGDDGHPREYELADTTISLTISDGEHKGRVLQLRQVTRRKPGGTRQVHILTTRPAAALPAAAVIYRMTSRWREENYFRYGRAHFALDALDTYAITPEDPARPVPNPAKKTAAAAVKAARKTLTSAETARRGKLAALHSPAPGTDTMITNQVLARLDAPVDGARRDLQAAQAAGRAIPAKIPLAEHNPAMVKLDTETKLITHAIRMAWVMSLVSVSSLTMAGLCSASGIFAGMALPAAWAACRSRRAPSTGASRRARTWLVIMVSVPGAGLCRAASLPRRAVSALVRVFLADLTAAAAGFFAGFGTG